MTGRDGAGRVHQLAELETQARIWGLLCQVALGKSWVVTATAGLGSCSAEGMSQPGTCGWGLPLGKGAKMLRGWSQHRPGALRGCPGEGLRQSLVGGRGAGAGPWEWDS